MAKSNKLLVVNGGYKTGSTMLFSILLDLFPVPINLEKSGYNENNISLNKTNFKSITETLVCKAHQSYAGFWSELRVQNLDFVFLITKRDLRTQINSYYFHWKQEKGGLSNSPFYIYGFLKAIEMELYNRQVEGLMREGKVYYINYTKDNESLFNSIKGIFLSEGINVADSNLRLAIDNNVGKVNVSKVGGADRNWFLNRSGLEFSGTGLVLIGAKIIVFLIPNTLLFFLMNKIRLK